MRRDMDMVRDLLMLKAESGVRETNAYDLEGEKSVIAYHVRIMTEAGLITSYVKPDDAFEPSSCYIFSLTWKGNDLLDAIQLNKVWCSVKKRLSQTVGTASLSVISDLTARQLIGVPRIRGDDPMCTLMKGRRRSFMGDTMETMIDDLPPYVVPNSYPPKYNSRKVADYCREMGIEDPSTLTKEQLEPFRLKKSEV